MNLYHVEVSAQPTAITRDQSAFFKWECTVEAEREGMAKTNAHLPENKPSKYSLDGHFCEYKITQLP